MKKLVFVVAIAAFSITATGQDSLVKNSNYTSPAPANNTNNTNKTFHWSIGVEPSVPVGNFQDFSGFGLGGSLEGEIKPGKKVGFTLNGGYINYFGKTVGAVKYDDFKYWPLLGGLKYYMSDKSYIHGQAGPGFGTSGLGTSFWYGAGIGFNLGKVMDAEIKYTGWNQNEITTTNGNNGYTGGNGGNGGSGGGNGGGGYGGHYSTIGLRLAYKF